jgi:hypothetical protein
MGLRFPLHRSLLSPSLMSVTIPLKTTVELGVVPTHIKFVGGLAPDECGPPPPR